jgi:hypothetical protein
MKIGEISKPNINKLELLEEELESFVTASF